MKCKLCEFESKNNLSLARHLRFNHNISLIDYKVKFDGFDIPKCICGNDAKHQDGIRFFSTCGNMDCVKKKQKEKRLEFMKNNPEQTAWRTKNLSYPESKFIKLLKEYKLDKQYLILREKSFFPYFVDFAFEGVKVAVEIDGSQHELPERKERDKKKDTLLNSLGWRVFRVTAREINEKGDLVISRLLSFIGDSKVFDNCGIKLSKSIKQINLEIKNKNQIERGGRNGLTTKEENKHILQRVVDRPSFKQLQKEIKELGYTGVGRKYGVSDNAIRKWIKTYETRGF